MNVNLKPSQRAAVVGVIDPDALGATDHSTAWIDASEFFNYLAVIQAGALGTDATFDAKLEEAQDASGTGAQDITDKAIAQLTQGSPDESDQQALINLRQDELSDGYTHFRLTITVGTAASDGGGFVLGLDPRYGPADEHDLASVAEIVD